MTSMEKVVSRLKMAAQTGLYSGLIMTPQDAAYIQRCTEQHLPTGVSLIFTRDTGHHSSGWWKNPDYERCYHLSIAFADFETGTWAPFSVGKAERLAKMFFGSDMKLCWIEPPHSPEGKAKGVHHYRLFCDSGWQPISPRGEVYSKEFTEKGWKSFSEIHGEAAGKYSPPMGYQA